MVVSPLAIIDEVRVWTAIGLTSWLPPLAVEGCSYCAFPKHLLDVSKKGSSRSRGYFRGSVLYGDLNFRPVPATRARPLEIRRSQDHVFRALVPTVVTTRERCVRPEASFGYQRFSRRRRPLPRSCQSHCPRTPGKPRVRHRACASRASRDRVLALNE